MRSGEDREGVRVWRAEEIESVHQVHAALAGADGALLARTGDPRRRAFLRSTAKPIQLLPLVEEGVADRFGFSPSELAVMAASHNAEPFHVEAVRSILAKAGLEPEWLKCSPHEPFHEPSAEALRRAGTQPTALHNNCSGKHAGMLAVSRALGWPLDTYCDPDHPLQRRILARLAELAGVPEAALGIGVDGCGAPTFALPVAAMATAFARLALADAERGDDRARAIGVVIDAMTAHPEYVAGSGRLCTDLMARLGERIVVKTGAEGVYAAVLRGMGRGLALKVADGAKRALDPALLALLEGLEALEGATRGSLECYARPAVMNRAGVAVGRIDARIDWTWISP
jgi:L-asparaginase II